MPLCPSLLRHRCFALVLFSTLLLSTVITASTATVAHAQMLPDGDYVIQLANSDMVLKPKGSSMGDRVALASRSSSAVWNFKHFGGDVYGAKRGELVLDVYMSQTASDTPLIIWPWHGEGNQRWKITREGGLYRLGSVHTKTVVTAKNRSQGAALVMEKPYGTTSARLEDQLFCIKKVGDNSPCTPDPQAKSPEPKTPAPKTEVFEDSFTSVRPKK